jgi:hypothetical protein
MWGTRFWWLVPPAWLAVLALGELQPPAARSACCYFAANKQDVRQPGQKAFITWSPRNRLESFTVQPKFEGNARDFGMVIPTPSRPKLDEMPRDFFKELAVFTLLKRREYPQSQLLVPQIGGIGGGFGGGFGGFGGLGMAAPQVPRRPSIQVVETGVVGSLDYKVITAGRADELYAWLKDNRYRYAGDEATLDFYVRKKWFFTVMKIDAMQMKKNQDGSYAGEVTPTRFQFTSDKLVYPLKITQLSVKDRTEALLYVQAPFKVDLPEDMTFQFQWVPMLQNAQGWYSKGVIRSHDLPGGADDWLKGIKGQAPDLLRRGEGLGFNFVSGQRPGPNEKGRSPTTLEWAQRLRAEDLQVLRGEAPFSEKVPNVDDGFTAADMKNPRRAKLATRVIELRLAKSSQDRPGGYLVREAPAEDVRQLRLLAGHLKEGQFLTKLRKAFTRGEMDDDLLIVPAKLGQAEDRSEYVEILPTSPP